MSAYDEAVRWISEQEDAGRTFTVAERCAILKDAGKFAQHQKFEASAAHKVAQGMKKGGKAGVKLGLAGTLFGIFK